MTKQTTREATEEGGLSAFAVRALGFDAPCRCGHEEGLHDSAGGCAVLGCECASFHSTMHPGKLPSEIK